MKCLETERLISYAYRLIDGPAASDVRAHLEDCSRCREMVEQHGRLDAVLSEWKAAEPTPSFDARVRQAVETAQTQRRAWRFWEWQWISGRALVWLGALTLAVVVWFMYGHRPFPSSSPVAARQPQQAVGTPAPVQVASRKTSSGMGEASVNAAKAAPRSKPAGAALSEDKDAQAMDDYDMAANFDLLSELPQTETRDVN